MKKLLHRHPGKRGLKTVITPLVLAVSLALSSCAKTPQKTAFKAPTERDTLYEYALSVFQRDTTVVQCDSIEGISLTLELTWEELFLTLSHVIDSFFSGAPDDLNDSIVKFYEQPSVRDGILSEAVREMMRISVPALAAKADGFTLSAEDAQTVSEWRDGLERDYSGADAFGALIWANLHETPQMFDKLVEYATIRHAYLKELFERELNEEKVGDTELIDYFGVGDTDSRLARICYASLTDEAKAQSIIDGFNKTGQSALPREDVRASFKDLADSVISEQDSFEESHSFVAGYGIVSDAMEKAALALDFYDISPVPLFDGGRYYVIMRLPIPASINEVTKDEFTIMRNIADEEVFDEVTSEWSDDLDRSIDAAEFTLAGGLENADIGDIFNRALLEKQYAN